MVKIQFQDNITKANANTFNTMQDNIENGINDGIIEAKNYTDELQTYSTNETRIGTWIDGKPLYRKVISAGTITASNTTIANIQNIDTLVSIKGSAYSSQFGQKYGIPNVHNSIAEYYINLLVSGNGVVIRYGSGFSQFDNVMAILEYTKTTD